VKSGTSTSTFIVVNQFAGSPIETLVDENRKSMVLATGFLGGDLPGIISGTSGDDFMDGRGGDDFLFGNGGNDHMLGGTGNDRLDGGKGNDILDGGPGDDILTGGDGRDTFVFAPGSGNDVVTDFVHGQDRLDLRAFDTSFRDLKTEDGHGEHGQGHRAAADDRITMHVDGHDTVLEFAGGSVRITGNTHLHADDFLWTATGSSSVAQASAGTTNSSTTVPGGGRVEISSAFAGTVTFAGDTGTLQLDNSASFSGTPSPAWPARIRSTSPVSTLRKCGTRAIPATARAARSP
jgi:hypothetical protein